MRTVAVLAVLVLAPLPDALTQELPLTPGQRVRVTCPQAGLDNAKADVVAIRGDTLVLQHERFRIDTHGRRHNDSLVTEVPVAAITRLAAYVGKKSRGRTGMFIGGTSMFVIGLISTAGYYSSGEEGYARYVFGGAVVTGALGAGIGWLIGSAIKSDWWEEVPLDRLRVSVTPRRDGLGIAASITF